MGRAFFSRSLWVGTMTRARSVWGAPPRSATPPSAGRPVISAQYDQRKRRVVGEDGVVADACEEDASRAPRDRVRLVRIAEDKGTPFERRGDHLAGHRGP